MDKFGRSCFFITLLLRFSKFTNMLVVQCFEKCTCNKAFSYLKKRIIDLRSSVHIGSFSEMGTKFQLISLAVIVVFAAANFNIFHETILVFTIFEPKSMVFRSEKVPKVSIVHFR